MPIILCLETATQICSVAISQNGKLLALEENHEGNTHASQLHILVQNAIDKAGISFNDLNGIAVSKGPGSYTGLRVGVSAAKGYCYALGIPLIAINTLESLLRVIRDQGLGKLEANSQWLTAKKQEPEAYFIPMLDARRMEVYCAVFDYNNKMINETEAKIIDEHSFSNLLGLKNVYFFGNGAAKCKSIINHKNAHFIEGITCSSSGMINLSFEAFQNKQFEDVAYFEPFYLKDFVGTVARKKS